MKKIQIILLFLVMNFISFSSYSHHSPAAFNMVETLNMQGTVSRYVWRNPHVYIYVDVNDSLGDQITWQIEADPTSLMSRSGWDAATLSPGDEVSFQLHPDRNTQKEHGLLVSLTKPDGMVLGLRSGEPAVKATANSLSGIWDALSNFSPAVTSQVFDPNRTYTEAGIIAQEEYDISLFPPSQCLPFQTPFLMIVPYLNEIEILEDRILINSEFYNVQRTIYMDGRRHPENGTRTIQGHSIGQWEDDKLIVDTTLFSDYRLANGPGVPSGAQKHTIETFLLSGDRTQLHVNIVVEDPEYLLEPFTASSVWDYAPNRTMENFGCDPENAVQFLSQ